MTLALSRGTFHKSTERVCAKICAVKALHLASLTTKAFFGKCQIFLSKRTGLLGIDVDQEGAGQAAVSKLQATGLASSFLLGPGFAQAPRSSLNSGRGLRPRIGSEPAASNPCRQYCRQKCVCYSYCDDYSADIPADQFANIVRTLIPVSVHVCGCNLLLHKPLNGKRNQEDRDSGYQHDPIDSYDSISWLKVGFVRSEWWGSGDAWKSSSSIMRTLKWSP
jgi:hypothetical protein